MSFILFSDSAVVYSEITDAMTAAVENLHPCNIYLIQMLNLALLVCICLKKIEEALNYGRMTLQGLE
jgi:hypothetical protein